MTAGDGAQHQDDGEDKFTVVLRILGQENGAILDGLIVQARIMRADVAHIHRRADERVQLLGREAIGLGDGPLIILGEDVVQLGEHAEGEQLHRCPDGELAAVLGLVMADERQIILTLDLDFEFVHQALVRSLRLPVGAEIGPVRVSGGTVGHRQMIGELGAQLHLEKLQHGEQLMAKTHIELIQIVQIVQRYAVDEELGIVLPAQMLAVGRQSVIIDRGENMARAVGVADVEVMNLEQAHRLLVIAPRGLDGRIDFLFLRRRIAHAILLKNAGQLVRRFCMFSSD